MASVKLIDVGVILELELSKAAFWEKNSIGYTIRVESSIADMLSV